MSSKPFVYVVRYSFNLFKNILRLTLKDLEHLGWLRENSGVCGGLGGSGPLSTYVEMCNH